jgi:hypothetical protein
VWLGADRPGQPLTGKLQHTLTVVADGELASPTFAVEFAAPVPVLDVVPELAIARRIRHDLIVARGYDIVGGRTARAVRYTPRRLTRIPRLTRSCGPNALAFL